jgi:hypothetical protein
MNKKWENHGRDLKSKNTIDPVSNDEDTTETVNIRDRKKADHSGVKTCDSRGFKKLDNLVTYQKPNNQDFNNENKDRGKEKEFERLKGEIVQEPKKLRFETNQKAKNGDKIQTNGFKNTRENCQKNSNSPNYIKIINETRKDTASRSKSGNNKEKSPNHESPHCFKTKTDENDFILNMKKNFYKTVEENKRLKEELEQSKLCNKKQTAKEKSNKIYSELDENRMLQLTTENKNLNEKISALQAELAHAKTDLKDIAFRQKDETFILLENSHLKEENHKLFSMLKSTNEYQTFAEFSDHENRLRYLKDLKFYQQLENIKDSATASPSTNCHKHTNFDNLLWVPEESFKLLHKISKTENLGLTSSLIDFILFELNKIWKKREEFIVSRTHVFCKNCTKPTKKYNSDSLPLQLSSDVKDSKINNLEAELAKAVSKLSAAQKIIRKGEKGTFNVHENKMLAANLKLINRNNSEHRMLANKNRFLSDINSILRKQLDEHLLKKFYNLQGWQENGYFISG